MIEFMEQYINKSALAAEIEKCYNECLKRSKITDSDYWNAKADVYRNVLVILDDTLEVKEEPVSEDLEEAAKYCIPDESYHMTIESKEEGSGENVYDYAQMLDVFKAGAKWQKEQDMQKFLHSEVATFTREEFDAEITKAKQKGIEIGKESK